MDLFKQPELAFVLVRITLGSTAEDVASFFDRTGFKLRAVNYHHIDAAEFAAYCEKFSRWPRYQRVLSSIVDQPFLAVVLQGRQAGQFCRKLLNKPNGHVYRTVYASDSEESALKDIYVWFRAHFPPVDEPFVTWLPQADLPALRGPSASWLWKEVNILFPPKLRIPLAHPDNHRPSLRYHPSAGVPLSIL